MIDNMANIRAKMLRELMRKRKEQKKEKTKVKASFNFDFASLYPTTMRTTLLPLQHKRIYKESDRDLKRYL